MAYEDDFGLDNWDDPFGGDFDMDMDFDVDPFKNKGFFSSLTTGFLSGIVDETVGSNTARIRTLRTLLPETFSNAFDRGNRLAERYESLKEEFKQQNVDSVRSLQTIAGTLSERFGDKMPSSMRDSFGDFSQKDFSHWERSGDSGPVMEGIEESSEWELTSLVSSLMENQESMFTGLGESLNNMTAFAAGTVSSAVMAGNRQLINIESGVRDLLDYQRNVQLKMDQAQVNLMAKNYVASIKYYKFMETGVHHQVAELRKITKGVMTSDYEKTSTYTAGKQYMRDNIFSTIGNRMGGLTGAIRNRFGKEARQNGYDAVAGPLGMIADAITMSDGMPMSKGMIGDMIGSEIASQLVNNIPHLLRSQGAKDAIAKLAGRNPEAAERFSKMYSDLTKTGSRASYMATSGVGMINHMASDWQALDEMPFLDYQDYVQSLKPGEKPMGKTRWTLQNAATNRGRAAINSFMSEMSEARGTQYTLRRRDPKDMVTAGVWTKANNITLTEVIPGLISRTNLLLEKYLGGNDQAELTSYNYMRGQFQTETQKQVSVQADLMPFSEFSRYATAALEFVDDLDPDRKLSATARREFAQVIAKDVDREKGFNPFYYLGDIPGISGSVLSEIHAVVRRHFGLKSDDVKRYNETSGMERLDIMTKMPTEESQERLNRAGNSASNLKDTFPNVAERIDLLRATGNEQLLRDLGVIYTENGIDKVNIEQFHERVGMFMENPNNPILKGVIPGQGGAGRPKRNAFDIPTRPTPSGDDSNVPPGSFGELTNSLNALTGRLEELAKGSVSAQTNQTAYFDTQTGEITSHIASIADTNSKMEVMLGALLEMAQAGKLFTGAPGSPSEEREEEKLSKSLFGRLKQVLPKDLATKGMETLIKNSPLVIGGLLGGIGGSFLHNPIAAVGMALGGVALGGLVKHWAEKDAASGGQEPNDEENIVDENGETVLEASKLNAGMYIDAITRRVLKSYREIKGPVIDTVTKAVVGLKELGGKIFGADGRAVVLRGITAAKDAIIAGYNFVNPLGRIQSMVEMGKAMLYQQDIYVKSDPKNPRLRASGFKNVEYWKDTNGTFSPVKGWNEIDGPVYDDQGNTLITQAEFEDGLITATGQAVRNVGGVASNIMGAGAGMAKAGFANVMGRFGFQKADGPTASVGGQTPRTGGVERRLDRIYKLLSQKFGIDVADEEIDGHSPAMRLNSLEDKARQAEEAQENKVKEAIIDIGESITGNKKKDGKGDKKEGEGLFGRLFGMMGNFLKNPIGTILGGIGGSLMASAGRLSSIGTALFSGVLGVASPLFKLLSSGLGALVKGLGFGKLLGAGSGLLSGAAGAAAGGGRGGKGAGRRGPKGKAGMLSRMGGGKLALAAMAGGTALEYFTGDSGEEEMTYEGTGKPNVFNKPEPEMMAADWAETAASFHPAVFLGTMAADTLMPKSTMDALRNTGVYFGSDGKFFSDRRDYEAYEANLKGVNVDGKTYRTVPMFESIQKRARMAMYGVENWRGELAQRIERLEMLLLPHVTITNGVASFKDAEAVFKIYEQFGQNSGAGLQDNVHTWFQARFKPIFLTWCAVANKAKFGDLTEFDNNKNHEAVIVTERVREVLTLLPQNPYDIDVKIDDDSPLMGRERTGYIVNTILKEMRKTYPSVDTETKISTYEEQRQKNLNPERSDNPLVGWFQDNFTNKSIVKSQEHVDKRYATSAEVKEIDISDMHKDGSTPIDPFTMARLAIYGNVDNINWRVDAVLKLDRYVESKMRTVGTKALFLGTTDETFELFKPLFRVDDGLVAGNWKTWFENRFLPVATEYFRLMYLYRGQAPKTGWQQLSATNKAEMATTLADMMVTVDGRLSSVWDVKAGPFTGTESGSSPDRAQIYIKSLDANAMKATLRDPVMEEETSKKVKERELDRIANNQQAERQRAQQMFRTMSGAGPGSATPMAGKNYAAGGFSNSMISPMNQGSSQYQGGFLDNLDTDFQVNSGEDRGITMSPEQGEQLLLNALLKAGVTDTKQLALALALAKVETGNFKSTVENTNWSAETMQRLFKNVPDRATAERIAALPPEQRAMFVYGTNPKARSLGNEKPEDGWRYRGRGFFQLTGKANYEKYARESGIDVVSNPELVSEDPNVVADSAVRYLLGNKAIKSIATTGDFDTAVRGINGGNAVPFTDQRRSAYTDYLSKLESGTLKVNGAGAPGAPKPEDPKPPAALAARGELPPDQIPSAADKNVPDSAKDRVNTSQGSAFSLLNKEMSSPTTGKNAVAAGAASGPTAAAPVSLEPKVSGNTPMKPDTNGPISRSTSGDSPSTASTTPPSMLAAPKQPAQGAPKAPDMTKVSDEGLATIMGGVVQQLAMINDQLKLSNQTVSGNNTQYVGLS